MNRIITGDDVRKSLKSDYEWKDLDERTQSILNGVADKLNDNHVHPLLALLTSYRVFLCNMPIALPDEMMKERTELLRCAGMFLDMHDQQEGKEGNHAQD